MDWKGCFRCLASPVPRPNTIDFFLWGYMKEKVYQMEIASREELVAKINTAAMDIHQHGLGHVQREDRRHAKRVFVQEGDILGICFRQLTISLPSLKQTCLLGVGSNADSYADYDLWKLQARTDNCVVMLFRTGNKVTSERQTELIGC
ncbi:hypothetical protein ANN_01413 [Periplaneta americana]|uniref:Uncharacterized protein n=1 Tax=Periplaneta americana TaxID=6978 RepID=A0ABQ8TV55_PERAM|nr:hypothetical protein ANN_01413 [Periplaneta americana]